ncbi:MAG: membrane associated rhomboid family serine protease [Verrucomicrobiales bacterium]|jgi:membrane associated rhomboid family serine protease
MGIYDRDYTQAEAGTPPSWSPGKISAPAVIWLFLTANLAVFVLQTAFRAEDSWGYKYPEGQFTYFVPLDATPSLKSQIIKFALSEGMGPPVELQSLKPIPKKAPSEEIAEINRENTKINRNNAQIRKRYLEPVYSGSESEAQAAFARNLAKIDAWRQRIQRTGGVSVEALENGKFWTLLSHQFVNATVFSLAISLIGIYILGRFVVGRVGSISFILIYILGGAAGALPILAAQLIIPEATSAILLDHLGALASVSALFGYLAMSMPTQSISARVFLFLQLQTGLRKLANLWIVINVGLFGLGLIFPGVGIGWLANAAGAICGLGLGRVFVGRGQTSQAQHSQTTSTSTSRRKGKGESRGRPYKTRDGDSKVIETQFTDEPPDYNEILDKINREGISALTDEEKKILEQASEDFGGKP